MSRDYGVVRRTFWESDTIRPLAADHKFVGLYLLTSPHTNAIGCFRLPTAYVAHDTGMTEKALTAGLAALNTVGFLEFCERSPWIWLPNFLKHNPPENPNVWRKCVKEMEALPAIRAQARIAAELHDIGNEDRMRNPNSKNRVSDEELRRLKRFEYGFETVAEGQRPEPCPKPKPQPKPEPLEERASAPPAKGTRWPSDRAVPNEWIADADIQRHEHSLPRIDLRLEATRFANYWASKSGANATKTDWHRTWINWALDDSKRKIGKVSAHDRGTEGAALFLAKVERGDTQGHRDRAGEVGPSPRLLPAGHGLPEMGSPVRDVPRGPEGTECGAASLGVQSVAQQSGQHEIPDAGAASASVRPVQNVIDATARSVSSFRR